MQLGPHLECVINDQAIRKFCLFCEGKVIRLVFTLITSSSGAGGPKKSLQWPTCIEFPRAAFWNSAQTSALTSNTANFLQCSQKNSQAFMASDMVAMEKVDPNVTGFLVRSDCTLNSTSQASSPCSLITETPSSCLFFVLSSKY